MTVDIQQTSSQSVAGGMGKSATTNLGMKPKSRPTSSYNRKYAKELHEKMVLLRKERVTLIKYVDYCKAAATLLELNSGISGILNKDMAAAKQLTTMDQTVTANPPEVKTHSVNWTTGAVVHEDGSSETLEVESLQQAKHAKAVSQAKKTRDSRNKILCELERTLERIETENQRMKKIILRIVINLKQKSESFKLDHKVLAASVTANNKK
mmetsp:Transcript_5044/g.7466  ORF Transcript_5044/g.7466 Transcript_5044/m.7466 type:complete len:210 (-) Transcript_5044:57-686(-)|eukprot:CAMPEP_0194575548 /NCGR_PEP_ID=MMETSP0292-20121207/10999_1 /TAXON_ID=39354 /ORGANISM="Heterosigma akashiwo, Strain CCMP2393" /LENGTH=209 /DNA_ID=CAMNT_0039427379 /DNA_START=106 /DNA_END=735 /DNA_ORIENTATION=+